MDKNIKFKDGRELLIEYDAGHISPDDNKKIISEMKDMDFSQDLVFYAVLQKFNTPNKNGRIYPEHLLKRENEKYQSLIKKGGALNELNHPSCHTGDVDILTSKGWKNIKEIDEFENIVTLNSEGIVENKLIYSKVTHKYNGNMITIKGKNIDVTVTPNHKFLIINKNNKKQEFITAQEILNSFKLTNKLSNYFIPKMTNNYEDEKTELIYLDKTFLNIHEEINKDGFVYSVDVPNHVYYVRSNNKCHWTGNSSLIDLDRVSHSIVETWWDGKILMGKLKLFTSPGWKKMGIVSTKGDQAAMLIMNGATLGISSRGVGSLKSERGQNIVQDDFELVCYDLVSSPSTPGAYIFNDPSERDNYQESIEKPLVNDRMKKLMGNIDNFLQK